MVQHGDQRWKGVMMSSPAEEPRVHFESRDEAPAHIPLGSPVALGVAAPSMRRAVTVEARLHGVDLRRRGDAECSFVVTDAESLADALPGSVIRPEDRRVWVRVGPKRDEELEVPVRLLDGPPAGRRLLARLRDASAGGLGLVFPAAAEERLCRVRSFVAQVAWPGFGGEREWTCDVRNRSRVDDGVRYGVQFRTELAATEPPGPQFEALWTCAFCGQLDLLAETHAHCPGCGMPRGEVETRLPDWDALVTAATHRFAGAELLCPACGVAHASIAVHCGHCGTML